jgi:hypothetical protein
LKRTRRRGIASSWNISRRSVISSWWGIALLPGYKHIGRRCITLRVLLLLSIITLVRGRGTSRIHLVQLVGLKINKVKTTFKLTAPTDYTTQLMDATQQRLDNSYCFGSIVSKDQLSKKSMLIFPSLDAVLFPATSSPNLVPFPFLDSIIGQGVSGMESQSWNWLASSLFLPFNCFRG